MAEINDLSDTDASNTARFPELQAPSTVNNGARALEGLVSRWHNTINGSVATAGAADTYVWACPQTLSAYYDGLMICVDINATNTGAATINVDALGAKAIKKHNDQALVAGDLESGGKYLLVYDGTNFQLLSSTAVAPITTYLSNLSEDTTPQLGGDLDLNGSNIDFPTTANISDCLDENDMATDSATVLATQQSIKAYVDTAIAALSTPIFTESFTSTDQTITAGGALTLAHSLSAAPTLIQLRIKENDAGGEAGYVQNDEVLYGFGEEAGGANNRGISIVPDATNVNVRFAADASVFTVINKSTGAAAGITASKWRLIVKAWA